MASLFTSWLLALVLGARHATEPDHVVAVSTLIADQPNARRATLLGAVWGIGHSISLLAVGGVLLLLRLEMPERIEVMFELAVAMMLVLLGTLSILRALRLGRQGKHHVHAHRHVQHVHAGPTDHVHVGAWSLAKRPLVIGLVHGLAGSGALVALAMANMPSLSSGLIYMLFFGVGSVVGMALLTGLAGLPLRQVSRNHRYQVALGVLAGTLSISAALVFAWPLLRQF
jgi:ABC-type nickel/cobalt efflux system permease component RcnA